MFQQFNNSVSLKEISDFLNTNFVGQNITINGISSLNKIQNNTLLFYSELSSIQFNIKDNSKYDLTKLDNYENIAIIADECLKTKINIHIHL